MHFLTLVLINPFQNQSAVAIQLRATRSVMLTLFLTYPWEQNQTILFQLQGNLVINLVPQKPKTETKVPQTLGYFLGGKKKSNSELSSRYLDEGYVAKLVACEFLPEYDNGSKPICNQTCAHNCQQYFRNQIDVLREEMTEWWGEHAESTLRRGLLYEDLKRGRNVDEMET